MSKKSQFHPDDIELVVAERLKGKTWVEISAKFPGSTPNAIRKLFYRETRDKQSVKPVKILCFDIETTPLLVYSWGLFDQNIPLDMVVEDWSVLSWSAKWVGAPEKEVMYDDTRAQKNVRDDKRILKSIWKLLDEADVVLTQNGKKFDEKKLNARFALHGLGKPSPFRHIDTLQIAKKHFAFTSNKLAYMTEQFCTKYVKSGHKKFPGNQLWIECLKGNIEAFDEMKEYNKLDVLSLEELYVDHLRKWDNTINLNPYHDEEMEYCSCGSTSFVKLNKVATTNLGRYELFKCKSCGKVTQGRTNLLSKEKRKTLRKA